MNPRRLHSATIFSIKFGTGFCIIVGRTMARSFPLSQADALANPWTILSSARHFLSRTTRTSPAALAHCNIFHGGIPCAAKWLGADGAERDSDGTFRRVVATT